MARGADITRAESIHALYKGAIARWTIDSLPSDWSSIRNRREAFHAARTLISLAGFGSALAAAYGSRDSAAPPV
jgi:hypothetical protein